MQSKLKVRFAGVTFEICTCRSPLWRSHYSVIWGEQIQGVVSIAIALSSWKVAPNPSVTGLYGEIALQTFGCKKSICVKCYLFFPCVLSHSSLGSGMSLLKTMPDALCVGNKKKKKTLARTHMYLSFFWSPWSHYQHAKWGHWVPKVIRPDAGFPVCLISLMFRQRRCSTTKPQSIPHHFSDSLNNWNGWFLKPIKNTPVKPVHEPALINVGCQFKCISF